MLMTRMTLSAAWIVLQGVQIAVNRMFVLPLEIWKIGQMLTKFIFWGIWTYESFNHTPMLNMLPIMPSIRIGTLPLLQRHQYLQEFNMLKNIYKHLLEEPVELSSL